MQVLGDHVFLLEERQEKPAVCAIRIPELLYPIIHNSAATENDLQISILQLGDGIQVSHQTRFSKRWRTPTLAGVHAVRDLTLLSISEQATEREERRIQVRKFLDPLSMLLPDAETLGAIPSYIPWMERRKNLLKTTGLVFTFCLGRYGMRPLWMEEDVEGNVTLLGLNSSEGDPRVLDIPKQVDLKNCRFIDWDDAEGVLCTLDGDYIRIIDFAS
jgi:hypothetical protein